MRHFILVPLLGIASALTILPAQANDGPSRREQAAQAKAELDRKFTPAFARENLISGTTTRAQVVALYGDHYQESASDSGSSLNYDKQDIRNRATGGIRRFADRVGSIAGLANVIPGANGSMASANAARATSPINHAGGSAAAIERARNSGDGYNSMDSLTVFFDSDNKVTGFSLH